MGRYMDRLMNRTGYIGVWMDEWIGRRMDWRVGE